MVTNKFDKTARKCYSKPAKGVEEDTILRKKPHRENPDVNQSVDALKGICRLSQIYRFRAVPPKIAVSGIGFSRYRDHERQRKLQAGWNRGI